MIGQRISRKRLDASMLGEDVSDEERGQISDLFRRVRGVAEEVAARRGRPFLLAIRVSDSIGYCRALGIDLHTLLGEDLVGIVTGSGYFKLDPWDHLVTLGLQYDTPVYAGMVARRLMDSGVPNAETDIMVW